MTFSPPSATRPSAISFSASRREQMPARAMTLAMRSPVLGFVVSAVFRMARLSAIVRAMKEQDEDYMRLALAQAEAAASRGEVPIGAVLVSADGEVLAKDGNSIVAARDPTAHAEMLVLRAGAARLGNERLTGTT